MAALRSVIDWFRAGYADDAPRTGYSPLIALHGPVALTPRQIERVVDELQDGPTDTTDIEVAITKATDRLPSDNQLRTVARALHHPPSRQHPSHPPANR
ncbi:DUF3349 domain-containing protein [Mycobacterium intracellulare]|uniref:DUF3349 domain-containing protein n=1 Tax=Mycobacterium intracellulare TaxID=1767 RepID=UPI001CDA2CE3|nr:DUF3349 domain-containing protein [Mycobacterium intracellulare]